MTVTIVTQTAVRPERTEDFSRWQAETSTVIAGFPGFVEQRLMPPNPPLQLDWVIVQRFGTMEDAQRWLGSNERASRIHGAAPMLIGRDDVHIVRDEAGIKPAPVSAIISTRVKPGKEAEYLAWVRKITAVQSKAPGMEGYRFEPPVPGVQEDFVAILRFDSEANLNAWLNSPVRKKLLEEAEPLTEESHARLANTGFEQWFRDVVQPGSAPPSVWKMDAIVLLLLYPVIFLWGAWFATPVLQNKLNMPWAVNLFIGNVFSVIALGFAVPWVANRMSWWLSPRSNPRQATLGGYVLILVLYLASVLIFWKLF